MAIKGFNRRLLCTRLVVSQISVSRGPFKNFPGISLVLHYVPVIVTKRRLMIPNNETILDIEESKNLLNTVYSRYLAEIFLPGTDCAHHSQVRYGDFFSEF